MELKIELDLYETRDQLNTADQELVAAAAEARMRAYAPYSEYKVGAALRLADGSIITGNNQENAAYPSGLCAERVALFAASSQFPDAVFTAIAVMTDSGIAEGNPAAPCGSCRQVLVEYESKQHHPIRVLMAGSERRVLVAHAAADLMPLCFTRQVLKKG